MTEDPDDVVAVDVDLPVALFADLDAYAVAHDTTYDDAVSDALDRLDEHNT